MDESQAIRPLRFLLRKPSFSEEQTPFDKAMVFDLREAIFRKNHALGRISCAEILRRRAFTIATEKAQSHTFMERTVLQLPA